MGLGNDSILRYRITAENDQLKRDLAAAKGRLNRFKNQSRGISSAIKTQFAGMFGVFAAGAVFRDISKTVAGFEKQMDKVAAISGATKREVSKLKDSAINLGRASKFTAIEIGQLQEELARLGFSSQEIIDSTDAIRKLATAADSELNESAKVLAATMNAFNIEAKESGEVANIMAESFSKSALDLQKFSVGMANVGATANAAGFSLSKTTALLGILNDAGIDASKAGTDLRKIFVEIAKNGSTLEEEILKLKTAEDKLTTSFDQFGQRALTSGIVLSENIVKIKSLTNTLSDSNKELDRMVGIMEDNLITDLQKLKSAWDGFILSIENGEGIISGFFRAYSQGLTDILNRLSNDSDSDIGYKIGENLEIENDNFQKEIDRFATKANELFNEIKKLEKNKMKTESRAFGLSSVTKIDPKIVAEINKQTKEWEKLNGIIDALSDRQKDLNKEKNKSKEIIESENEAIRAQIKAFKNLQAERSNIPSLESKMPDIKPLSNQEIGLGALTGRGQLSHDYYAKVKEKMKEDRKKFDSFLQSQADELNAIINATIGESIINGLSTAIETGSLEQAFASFLNTIGDGLQRFGAALLAFGIALQAFEKAPPGVKIAAGIAAIAAGAIVKKAASSLAASSSSGVGGGSGRSGSFSGNIEGQSAFNFEPKPVKLKFENGAITGQLEWEKRSNSRNRATG